MDSFKENGVNGSAFVLAYKKVICFISFFKFSLFKLKK